MEYIICPKCGNPECHQDDPYCWNCGSILGNRCENPECPQVSLSDDGIVNLPDNYCFCPDCGKPSRYYENGLIQPLKFQP